MKKFTFHAEVKALESKQDGEEENLDTVRVEGFASTKDIDRMNDIVAPSAFDEAVKLFMASSPILTFNHNFFGIPIGHVEEAEVTSRGLFVKAFVDGVTDMAKEVARSIRAKTLRAMSFTFIPLASEELDPDKNKGAKRKITDLDLLEVSIVTIPANARATFSMAKGALFGTDLFGQRSTDEEIERETEKLLGTKVFYINAPKQKEEPVVSKSVSPKVSPPTDSGTPKSYPFTVPCKSCEEDLLTNACTCGDTVPQKSVRVLAFAKGKFTEEEAIAWTEARGFSVEKGLHNDSQFRYIQFPKSEINGASEVIKLDEGVKALICTRVEKIAPVDDDSSADSADDIDPGTVDDSTGITSASSEKSTEDETEEVRAVLTEVIETLAG